jgi:hypothetical protein
MWQIAMKMLTGDRLKYFGLMAGIAFAALLIAQQASILVGFIRQTVALLALGRRLGRRTQARRRRSLTVRPAIRSGDARRGCRNKVPASGVA